MKATSEIVLTSYSSTNLREGMKPSKPLIDGILWEGDLVMLLGSEKAGKSIFGKQMGSCLTSGTKFLDKYHVPEKKKVLYVQAEGKRSDFVARMDCMNWVVQCDDNLFFHLPKKFIPLDVPDYFDALEKQIIEITPDVLFLDPIYMCMQGDLTLNQPARVFLSKVAQLMDKYSLTVVLVHHDSKEQYDKDHKKVERGDKGSYGSVFFRANVDHILYLEKHKDKTRTLSCETQRSGRVLETETLLLIEPNPLLFEIKADFKPFERAVYHHVASRPSGITTQEIVEVSKLSSSAVEKALCELFLRNKISKDDEKRPVIFFKR